MDQDEAMMRIFQRPEVLETIFKYLDFETLKNCRHVCKIWNEEVSRRLKRISITAMDSYDITKFRKLINQQMSLQLPSPFKRLKLKSVYCWEEKKEILTGLINDMDLELVTLESSFTNSDLLSTLSSSFCYSSLASLALIFKDAFPTRMNIALPPRLQAHFPQLKLFTVTYWGMYGGTINEACDSIVIQIISSSPKLCELTLDADDDINNSLLRKLCQNNLENIRNVKYWAKRGKSISQFRININWIRCDDSYVHT